MMSTAVPRQVYNARKRQAGGDTAQQYFARTESIAGVQDMRFQELMPDPLHWCAPARGSPRRARAPAASLAGGCAQLTPAPARCSPARLSCPRRRLGITKIDRFISMSNMKYDAIVESGIRIVERVDIPEELIPCDAHVEIDAKVFAGYFAGAKKAKTFDDLQKTVGRELG